MVLAMSVTVAKLMPHYAAPALGAMTILFVTAARFFSQLHRKGVRFGHALTVVMFVAVALSALVQLTFPHRETGWFDERVAIQERLAANGRHFVLVEYGPNHLRPDAEWVHNEPDVDASAVVWGRSLGPTEDEAFARYYAGRQGWRLRVDSDAGPFELVPFELQAGTR